MVKEENDKKADSLRMESKAITDQLKKIDSEMARKNHFLRTLVKGSGESELSVEIIRTLFERIEVYPGRRVKVILAFKRSGQMV